MTALETWCLAMIGLVFEALLAYVVVLFWLFRERALQAKKIPSEMEVAPRYNC